MGDFPLPLKASLNAGSGHTSIPILTERPDFMVENWPHHPLIAGVYHGRGHASRELAQQYAAYMVKAVNCHEDAKQLASAVAEYRTAHDKHGAAHLATGRAWDIMRRRLETFLAKAGAL